MTPQELKNSILQRAIQGKLVKQRAEEGTGEELYQQIQKEKSDLIKAKKIKQEKPLPEITEDEVPFEVPESWKWIRLGDVFSFINGDRGKNYPSKDKLSDSGEIPFISAINMKNDTVSEDGLLYVSQSQYDALGSGKLIKGDIVLCIRGSLGKCCVYPFEKGAIASSLVILRKLGNIDTTYIMSYINSPLFFTEIKKYDNGTAQPNLSARDAQKFLLPLPPLAEQHRIVAKIEELLPYIDRYEAAYTKLEDFNKRFPVDMQKSILQMAIQGKLVEQCPEEGTGEELYQQIQQEKQALIKAGKIKKETPLPGIAEDEIPFDIPESWKWVRLGDLAQLITKGSSPKWQGIRYVEKGLLFVTSENVGVNSLLWENKKYVEEKFNELSPRSQLKRGDLLTNIVGASIGRTAIYDIDEPANINQAVCIIRLVEMSILTYILMYMNSATAYRIMMSDKVDTARANISLTNISNFLVPLPPLAEQKRIVAKLEALLPFCDRLK